MVSEVLVLFLEALEFLVFLDGFSKGCFAYFVCEDGKIFFFCNSPIPLFFSEFLPYGNPSQSLVYPFLGVSFEPIILFHSVLG